MDALELLVELAVVWPTMAKRWHKGLSLSVSVVPSRNEHAHRQVEGFGTAAEEDLDMDDKEGMYRHRYRENLEADGDHEDRDEVRFPLSALSPALIKGGVVGHDATRTGCEKGEQCNFYSSRGGYVVFIGDCGVNASQSEWCSIDPRRDASASESSISNAWKSVSS